MFRHVLVIIMFTIESWLQIGCKILKTQRKLVFSENMMTKKHENTPIAKQGFSNLIREGGRTVGSGRVATIIE